MSTIVRLALLTTTTLILAPALPAQQMPGMDHQHHPPTPSNTPASPAEPTQSQQEHVPPDPPAAQDDHPMSYREMARVMEMDDTSATGMLLFDRLEWRDATRGSALAWNADAWYGNDAHKFWLKSEGSRQNGKTTAARTEALWDRPVTRWWNLQAGARHDAGSGASRNWVAVGVQGLAPGFFDVEATAYVGDSGRAAVRFSAERDVLFTQRLILQPELEVNVYSKADPENRLGSGVSDLELALRLRYEIRREFATYFGIVWARRFGTTADLARASGEEASDAQFLAGVRIWL